MARMIPATVHPNVKSGAERRLFDVLRDAPATDEWVCLHSLGLAHHDKKRRSEIDFLLLTRRGIFVLEVKGGRICRRNGVWVHTNRFGVEEVRHESPFDQASGAMFSLEREIRDHFGKTSRIGRLLFGYGIMFPDIHFESVGVEADSRTVFDVRDRREPFTTYIERLANFARESDPTLRYAPTTADIDQLVKFLRPDFDLVPTLSVHIDQASENLLSLAEEQYAVLDAFGGVPRLVVQGGAGTGKTLLALECCIREARSGTRNILFLCYNRLLAAYLVERLRQSPDSSSIVVRSVFGFMHDLITASSLADEFAVRKKEMPENQLYSELYPEFAALAALELNNSPCEVLVLDEAQDVMSDGILDVLDASVKGGLESGRWRMFCDINNQGAVYGQHEGHAFDRLRRFGVVTLLSTNRRNTRQIADETCMLSSPTVRSAGVIAGAPVEYVWYESDSAQTKRLKELLQRLFKHGVRPGQITILSTRHFESSCAAALREPALTQITASDIALFAVGRMKTVSWATVSSFKGLENDIIILTDIESLETEWWKSVVYVGMSRARAALYMLLSDTLKNTYESRLRDWISENGSDSHIPPEGA